MRISDWSSDVCSSDLIEACSNGATLAPYALNNPALLLVLKTIRGDITPQDWDGFQKRLETVQMSPDNRRATLILTHHLSKGVKLDKQRLLKALATLTQRGSVKPIDLASMGYFIMNELAEPEMAIPYLVRAIEAVTQDNPFPQQLGAEPRAKVRKDLD